MHSLALALTLTFNHLAELLQATTMLFGPMYLTYGSATEHEYLIRCVRDYTVKPPNKGHIGDGPVVPCREVVLFSEVFFIPIGTSLKMKNNL